MSGDTSGDGCRQVPSRKFYADRAQEMFRLRTVEGLSLTAIGARFGVSRSRAHQIISAYVRETTGRSADLAQLSRDAATIRRIRRLNAIIDAYLSETTSSFDSAQLSRTAAVAIEQTPGPTEQADALHALLFILSPRERRILIDREVLNLPVAVVAKRQHMSAAAVRQACSRALRRLRRAADETPR